jgi:hypothetical protein
MTADKCWETVLLICCLLRQLLRRVAWSVAAEIQTDRRAKLAKGVWRPSAVVGGSSASRLPGKQQVVCFEHQRPSCVVSACVPCTSSRWPSIATALTV